MSDLRIFKVTGYRPVVGNKVEYFRAVSDQHVLQHIKQEGPEQGGFVTYSVEEVDAVPVELNIDCPSCGVNFESPDRVKKIN